ncbi:MAG: radical SAM protein [Candidatus Falkowbacteria bacterium]
MNFLIVVPRFSKPGEFYSFPFGLAYISSHLKRAGFSVRCLNLSHYNENLSTKEILKKEIADNNIGVVMSGGMTGHWQLVNDVFRTVKKIKAEITTVAGGPIITADPELAINHLNIDFGVIGEGEITAAELARSLNKKTDHSAIKGIVYKKGGRIIKTPERPAIKSLDELTFPDYESLGYDEWIKLMQYSGQSPVLENYDNVRYSPIIGSRSCPFSCTFCYHPLGKIYRQRSLDNIFKEIDYLINTYQTNYLSFSDELFSADLKRLYEFADRIKPYSIKWDAQFRVNNITKEMLLKLKESNLSYMAFGVESMSDPILTSMKKMTTKTEIENAFRLAREVGVLCSGNIILGDPEETIDTANESIEWWKSHRYYNVSLGFIKAVPDSPDYRYALKRGLIKDKLEHIRDNFPAINMSRIPDEKFNKIMEEVGSYRNNLKYILDGKLIESKKLEEKYNNANFYVLQIECPACGHADNYKKFMKSLGKYTTVFCKKCYAQLKVGQSKAFYDDYSFIKMKLNPYVRRFYGFLLKKNLIRRDSQLIIPVKKFAQKIFKRASI